MEDHQKELLEYFQFLPEIVPDQHDGSYLLVRETVRALSSVAQEQMDEKDLELLYFATVGTFSPAGRFAKKRKQVAVSHLSSEEKQRLVFILEQLENTAKSYANSTRSGSIGMFGTGFATFNRNGGVTKTDAQKLIALCIAVMFEPDEERCLRLAEDSLKLQMHGIGIATVSQTLHCIKPNIFPVFNLGKEAGIEVYRKGLGIKLNSPEDIRKYVDNIRKVREFRNQHFSFKNYRVLDCGWWDVQGMKPLQLSLRPALYYKIKQRAAREGKSMDQTIVDILEFIA